MVEREGLADWAEERDAGRVVSIARILASEFGDYLLEDGLRAAAGETEAGAAAAVRRALVRLCVGLRAFHGEHPGDSGAALRESQQILDAAANPLSLLAELFAILADHERMHARAARALSQLADRTDEARYPSLEGRISWWRGILEGRARHFEEALRFYAQGTQLMARSSGPDGAYFGEVLQAEALGRIGDISGALRHYFTAISALVDLGEQRGRHSMLVTVAQTLMNHGQDAFARHFVREVYLALDGQRDPIVRVEVGLLRSRWARRAGRHDLALRALEDVRSQLLRTRMTSVAESRELERRLELGMVLANSEPLRSLEMLRGASTHLHERGKETEAIRALTAEAEAHRALGDEIAEYNALQRVLAHFETIRDLLVEPGLRTVAFHQAQRAIDRLTEIELDRGGEADAAAGLLISDQGRARFLMDLTQQWVAGRADEQDLRIVQASLGDSAVLLEFAVLGERIVVWKVTQSSIERSTLPVPASVLEPKVERFHHLLTVRAPVAQLHHLGEELFSLILAPLALGSDWARVIYVPDRFLTLLPLGALRDPARNAFLIESSAVVLYPSLRMFGAHERAARRAPSERRALVVANSLPGTSEGLPALPGARAEAARISASYEQAVSLMDGEATVGNFLARIADANVLHVATHAIADTDASHRSRLLLAEDEGRSGALFASSLFTRDLSHYDLVVLAACSTSVGFDVDREGLLGLAGSFFAGGARSVLATRWEVDDRSASHLVTAFHREYLAGGQASLALKRSLAEYRRTGDSHPSDWAAFLLIGDTKETA